MTDIPQTATDHRGTVEILRLIEETRKFTAEQHKLIDEASKFRVERWIVPIAIIFNLASGAAGGAVVAWLLMHTPR